MRASRLGSVAGAATAPFETERRRRFLGIARDRRSFETALLALPATLFMLLVFAVPLAGVVHQSLTTDEGEFTAAAYSEIARSELFGRVGLTTLEISLLATLFALLLGYPIAYYLSKQPPRRRAILLGLVLVPFWTSILVKSFAFTVLLGQSGIVNQLLASLGLGPLKLLFNRVGVIVGMSHHLVPFMVFTILASLQSQPPELARAAAIMGAGRLRIFLRVTLPLSMPGVMAGSLLVLIISMGFFVVPALLGGRRDMMLANLVDFYIRESLNWPLASAIAVVLLAAAMMLAAGLSKLPGGSVLLGAEER